MTRMITAAALAALTAGSAIAQQATVDMTDTDNLIRTRDITGGEIYSLNTMVEDDMWTDTGMYDAVDTNWSDIGEIEDVILSKDGQMIGIVAEVGGFLDIGDKHVMIGVDDVRLVAVDDQTYAYVTRMSEEQLEEMPAVDEGWWN